VSAGLRFPARLRTTGTELERELLQSARREHPTRELSERMASALGIAVSVLPAARPVPTKRPAFLARFVTFARARAPWVITAALIAASAGVGYELIVR